MPSNAKNRLSNTRSRKHSSKERLKVIIWGFILLFVLSFIVMIFIYSWTTYEKLPRRDNNTGCIIENGKIDQRTVVLADLSDNLSERHKIDLPTVIDTILGSLNPDEELSFFLLNGSQPPSLPIPAVNFCAPPSDGVATAKYIRQQHDKFLRDKKEILMKLATDKPSPSVGDSSIFEYIYSITNNILQKNLSSRRLIIISDLLQNTPEFPQYALLPKFSNFRNTAYYKKIRPDLNGVNVTVYYINRNKYYKLQTDDHKNFWYSYFKDTGATLNPPFFSVLNDDTQPPAKKYGP